MLKSVWIRCRALLMSDRIESILPTAVCFTLVACILGVVIHTRRMCVTDRSIVQVSASPGSSKVVEPVMDAPPTTDSSLSLPGPEPEVEVHVRRVSSLDCDAELSGYCDFQLEIDVLRHGSDSEGETSSRH
jgi:hypothetical protein